MKIKLFFWIIFTYILLTGCEDLTQKECCTDHYLDIDAQNLSNINGYYELEFLDGYAQTFTSIRAKTNSKNEYQKLAWIADKEIFIEGFWINLVNMNSYTNKNGESFTVLAVWEEFIGDTITIYCAYDDNCFSFLDSLKVIVN